MKKKELIQSIDKTLEEIFILKQQIRECSDPNKQKQLKLSLKELRYKQLWQIDLFERLEEKA